MLTLKRLLENRKALLERTRSGDISDNFIDIYYRKIDAIDHDIRNHKYKAPSEANQAK